MSGITAVTKAQVFIGGTSYPPTIGTTLALADYTSEATYTQIGGLTSIGDFGDTSEEIKVQVLGDDRVYKLKGARDAGDLPLEAVFMDADAGQQAIMAAEAGDGNFSFKVVYNNQGPTGKGSTFYFRGLVTSVQQKNGAANAVAMLSIKIAINSAPLLALAS